MKYFTKVALATSLALTTSLTAPAAIAEEASYILATASTGGTYYPVGVALSTLVKVKLEPRDKIGMSAISSAGSGENVRLLREGEAQFAIMQGLYGFYAASGTGPLEEAGAQTNLRSVSMLWQNVEQFVVSSDAATTGTMADMVALKGSAMALGKVHGGYGPSAEALQNGQVAGIGTPAGVPTGAISQLMAAAGDSVTMLSFTDEQAAAADGGKDLWTPYLIPAGTYPNQDTDVNTIAQPNFLATDASISEENVYMITKTIYENLPFLQAIHPATKVMAIEAAIAGLPVPLHPGAARYYAEVGVDIPERLIAE
jgi:TRAP-type uncharacterized transport system substrate-binding protein